MRIPLVVTLVSAAISLPAAEPTWNEVFAILDARCTECHGPAKQKAGLRLDTPEWLQHGSKDGAVVVAGKPAESKLYTLAAHPADNDDRMPPKGDRLTDAQLTVLKTWIAAGASYAAAGPAKAAAEPTKEGAPVALPVPAVVAIPAAPVPVAPATAEPVIESLRSNHITVSKLAGGWLDINAAHTKNGITAEQLEILSKAAPAIAYLDLANSGLTDKQTALIGACTKLRRLHLEGNPLSDAALPALAKLGDLEYLNLTNTQITDSGLVHFKALAHLDQLYLWQSKVTPAGIAELQKALPHTTIVLGPDDLPTDKMSPGKGKKKKK